MRSGTILKALAVLVAVTAIALVAVVKTIDVDDYGQRIAAAIAAETGRQVTVGGEFRLDLSLAPRLVATDVRLAGLPGAARADMLRIARVEAEIGLVPLLRREVQIRRLLLSEPDLMLDHDAAGRPNWDFVGQAARPRARGAGEPATTLAIGRIHVEKARVSFYDATGGLHGLVLDRLTFDSPADTAPIAFNARGMLDQQRLELSGVLGSWAELQRQTRPFPLNAKASVGGLIVVADGSVASLAGLEGIDVKVALETNEVVAAAQLVGLDVPEIGRLRASARLTGTAATPQLSEIDAAFGRRDTLRVAARGTVRAPLALDGIELILTAEAPAPGRLLAQLGLDAQDGQPLKASAHLSRHGGPLELSGLKASAGQSDLAGTASLRLDGKQPHLAAALASTRLDIGDLGLPASAEAPAAAVQPAALPDRPVVLAIPPGLDADVSWRAETLVAGAVAEQVALSLRAVGGVLTLRPTAGLAELVRVATTAATASLQR